MDNREKSGEEINNTTTRDTQAVQPNSQPVVGTPVQAQVEQNQGQQNQ